MEGTVGHVKPERVQRGTEHLSPGMGWRWGGHGVQPGEPEGEGRQPPRAAQPRHPRGEVPPRWLRLPGSHRAHGKGTGCRTAGRAAQPCPARAAAGAGTANRRGMKSEADPGSIPPLLPPGNVSSGGGDFHRECLDFPNPLPQTAGLTTASAHSPPAKWEGPLFRGGPQEPGLISLLETNPWEVSPKGFGTGFEASIQASCSQKEHPSRANHPKG